MTVAIKAPTAADYQRLFEVERQQVYPVIDRYEAEMGFALDRDRLEAAGRVLACPMKKNAPNWQHGRVLYATVRRYIADRRRVQDPSPLALLDVGTAKGFSALCMLWALRDADVPGTVVSVDVIDPHGRVPRNTVADPDGQKTLAEILEPWPEAQAIQFEQSTGVDWLTCSHSRIHVAFIDGNHTGPVVGEEGRLLARRQATDDIAVFDDVNKKGIGTAILFGPVRQSYALTRIDLKHERAYAIGVRRE